MDGLIAGRPGAKASDTRLLALNEVRSRLGFLLDAGLGYPNLDRMTRSLSGGETGRVNPDQSPGVAAGQHVVCAG